MSKAIKAPEDLVVLVKSGLQWMALRRCVKAALAKHTIAECGGLVKASAEMGLFPTTLIDWNRHLQSAEWNGLAPEGQQALASVVARMWAKEKHAETFLLKFRRSVAQAAIEVSGSKQAAAAALRANPLSLYRWAREVVQSKTPRRTA